jgi:group I intron endonuclease
MFSSKIIAGIYLIKNSINGKVYTGSSINIKNRLNKHRSCLKHNKHGNKHLQASFKKYGEEVFHFETIKEVATIWNLKSWTQKEKKFLKPQLIYWEQYYEDLYDSSNPKKGYNQDPIAGSRLGSKTKEKTKQLQRKWNKKYWTTERRKDFGNKIRGENNPRYKTENHTIETRECACGCRETFETTKNNKKRFICGHGLRGKPSNSRGHVFKLSEEQIEKKRGKKNPMYGENVKDHMSPEAFEIMCKKISEANTGKRKTAETKNKISKSLTGRIVSDETKKKISLAKIGKSPSNKIPEDTRNEIKEKYERGSSVEELANTYNKNKATISRILQSLNVVIRKTKRVPWNKGLSKENDVRLAKAGQKISQTKSSMIE